MYLMVLLAIADLSGLTIVVVPAGRCESSRPMASRRCLHSQNAWIQKYVRQNMPPGFERPAAIDLWVSVVWRLGVVKRGPSVRFPVAQRVALFDPDTPDCNQLGAGGPG
jgi:hypothetical protein